MLSNLSTPWRTLLETFEIDEEAFRSPTIFPPPEEIFNALRAGRCADPSTVRVVILGQDPYPTKGNAHGMAFSVKKGVAIPASLRNIYKELMEDLGTAVPITPRSTMNIVEGAPTLAPTSGNLQGWAEQGVLLL